MARIKILHFVHSLVSGGAEKQLRLLSGGLDKKRFEVAIFCVNDDGSDIDCSDITIFKAKKTKRFSLSYWYELNKVVKNFSPDLVHVWLPASVSIPAMVISRMHRKKVIFSYRNKMYFHRPLSYPEFFIAGICADRIISNHDIVDSHRLFKWLYRKKCGVVINNAVSVPKEFTKTDIDFQVGRRMVFVGRLTEQKNLFRLVQALSGVNKKHGWRLEVFGEGEDRAAIEEWISDKNLGEKIILKGFSTSVYSELNTASALLFPSLKEGMPNVLVEAMAIGLPIVAADIAGNRSVVGWEDEESVVWVDPWDIGDMSEKINNFLSGEYNIFNMVKSGQEISRSFTLSKMVDTYQQSYVDLLGEGYALTS